MHSLPPAWRPTERTAPRVFDAFPGLKHSVPWIPLAHVPTPVQSLDFLAQWFGRTGLWMKRDDLISPLYGGNKIRRYEHVLADALARNAQTIVTAGGLASTQATATTLFGRALGFHVKVVLFDQPVTTFARESLLANAHAGAELIDGGGYLQTAIQTARARYQDRRSYLILPGAANALANLGYIDAMLELGDQVQRGELPRPDAIVLPTGSSGTLAALALGCAWLGWDTEILGVRITARIACNRPLIRLIAHNTRSFVEQRQPGVGRRMKHIRYRLLHDAIGEGYGFPTRESIEAVGVVQRMIGAPGEVTYSGKAVAALRAIGQLPAWRNKSLLLWNTLSAVRPPAPPEARALLPARLQKLFDGPVEV